MLPGIRSGSEKELIKRTGTGSLFLKNKQIIKSCA